MPVNAVRTPTSPPIVMTKEHLKKAKKTLSAEINRVYNTQKKLSSAIEKDWREMSRIRVIIQEITAISNAREENPLLRFKNGHFKNGARHNLIKEHLYRHRYAYERRTAAYNVGSTVPEITAREALDTYQYTLASLEQRIDHSLLEINVLDEKFDTLILQEAALEKALNKITPLPNNRQKVATQKGNIKISDAEVKAIEKKIELFDIIYQSSAGCTGINHWLRQQRDSLSGDAEKAGKKLASKVISEYKKSHGEGIFVKNMISEFDIKFHASDILSNLPSYQEMLHRPKGKLIETFRGERMTLTGIDELAARFKTEPQAVYQLGQFYSTTARPAFAESLASADGPENRAGVIFTLKGNSGHPVIVGHGFDYHADREHEILYSPLACFCVTDMTFDGRHHRVGLQEMKRETVSEPYPMPH